MKDIFSKEDLHAIGFLMKKNNVEYVQSCCGKVNIIFYEKNIAGSIFGEKGICGKYY